MYKKSLYLSRLFLQRKPNLTQIVLKQKPYFIKLSNQQMIHFSDKKQNNDENEKDKKEEEKQKEMKEKQEKKNKKKQQKKELKKDFQEYLENVKDQVIEAMEIKRLKKRIYQKYQEMSEQQKIVIILLTGAILYQLYNQFLIDNEISFNELLNTYLAQDMVEEIKIFKYNKKGKLNEAEVVLFTGESKRLQIGNLDFFLKKVEEVQLESEKKQENMVPISFGNFLNTRYYYERFTNNFLLVFQIVSLSVLITLRNRSLGIMGNQIQRNELKEKIFEMQTGMKIKFKDVAGQQESKQEIMEFVEFLKNPEKYDKIGARMPRGALLSGPPGTGKTLLAKACAGEAGVPFFYLSGSEFVEMFVGVGASRVRKLFKKAKQNSPAIIFIDEIDAIGKKRDGQQHNQNEEKDNTLNQLLVEMDGFSTKEYVVIMGATNRAELLDKALTRPGRFDRNIQITLPDLQARQDIFMVHLRPLVLQHQDNIKEYARRLATLTPGFSGAEIANLCNEAAILAGRHNQQYVSSDEFEKASERIIAGLEKKGLVDQEDRRKVAVHESGHAVCGWFLAGCPPLLKLTILPRTKGSLGFAQYLPSENNLMMQQELVDQLVFILGGRMAELEFYQESTTGASDDLQKAYEIAYKMVTKYGMSTTIGPRYFEDEAAVKPYSQQTEAQIDEEIEHIISIATQTAADMVHKHVHHIRLLSEQLLLHDTLDLHQITQVLGPRPVEYSDHLKQYLQVSQEFKNT